MTLKPYLVVPNLIEQPTWGGEYIVEHKQITKPQLKNKKIGQAYELYEFTRLSNKLSTLKNPSLELGNPKKPEEAKLIASDDQVFSLQELIDQDPVKVLGKKYVDQFGPIMRTLIKMTQAKGNSYQIHVKEPVNNWLPKPESWYYFEPGLVTLGVKAGANWDQYQQVCQEIDQVAQKISQQIKAGELKLEQGREKLAELIAQLNPEQFVNLLTIKANQAIDLSACGIHHSWEEDEAIAPCGNIVYEVQENVYDDASTIRSFDKGKIKDDGSIRELQIDDYFKYVDHSDWANHPENHLIETNLVKKDKNARVDQIFDNSKYKLQKIKFNQTWSDQTTDSFHHLFVKEGTIALENMTITPGFSVFVPANTGQYLLKSDSATVLKTYL